MEDSIITISWDFPKLTSFPVQFILNLTLGNFNESRSLIKIVDHVLSYNFTIADVNPCELFSLCVTTTDNVSHSEPSCIDGRLPTSYDNETQGVSIICATTLNQMYHINCQYVSACNVTGCIYIFKGDNVPNSMNTIQGNEIQTQMVNFTRYRHVTVYDTYGNLVTNRTLDFNETGLCYPTTITGVYVFHDRV